MCRSDAQSSTVLSDPTQALDENFINFMLELVKSGLDACENPSGAKALVVKALKAMTK